MIEIKNEEGFEYLSTIKNNSIDLILTDPPYITSTESGMNTLYKKVKENEEKGIEFIKTEEEWERVKSRYIEKDIPESVMKSNYMHYGNIYGKKYAVKTDYGDWDKEFSMDILDKVHKVEVIEDSPYDPNNDLIRA